MKYLYFSLMLMFFWGCKKDSTPVQFDGAYSGSLTAYSGGQEIIAPTEITMEDGKFLVTKGYKFGSGTYNVKSSSEIKFIDENFWTAEFDWSLLLSGNYKYEFRGKQLILTKIMSDGSCFLCKDKSKNRYQYKLNRK